MTNEEAKKRVEFLINALIQGESSMRYKIAKEGIDWIDLIMRKNADYGSSVHNPPVLMPEMPPASAIMVRMSDKIQRIAHLLTVRSFSFIDESLEDSIRDLGAYCLLYLIGPRREKGSE